MFKLLFSIILVFVIIYKYDITLIEMFQHLFQHKYLLVPVFFIYTYSFLLIFPSSCFC